MGASESHTHTAIEGTYMSCELYSKRQRTINSYREKSNTGFVGLKNHGATCYMNSLLQMLYMTPEFRSAVLAWRIEQNSANLKGIPYRLQSLYAKLKESKRPWVPTEKLIESFGWSPSERYVQHDVQELNRVLCDALQTYVQRMGLPNFTELFEGKIHDYLECKNCQKKRGRVDTFLDVSISLESTIEDGVRSFVTPEHLGEGNEVTCESCAAAHQHEKGLQFEVLPALLAVHLRRFDFDMNTCERIKIYRDIDIPLTLNMEPFLQPGKRDQAHLHFDLIGVIVHRGSAGGGHYFVYLKDVSSGRWAKFDDDTVDFVSDEFIMNLLMPSTRKPEASSSFEKDQVQTTAEVAESEVEAFFNDFRSKSKKNHSSRMEAQPYYCLYRSTNLPPVQESEVAEYLMEEIRQENEEQMKEAEEYNRVKDFVEVNIHHKGSDNWMVFTKHDTIAKVTEQAYQEICSEEDRQSLKLENIRLRRYQRYDGVFGESFETRMQETLDSVGIVPLTVLAFEQKTDADEWKPAKEYNVSFDVVLMIDDKPTESYHFQFPPDTLFSVLMEKAAALVQRDQSNLLIFTTRFVSEHVNIVEDMSHSTPLSEIASKHGNQFTVEDRTTLKMNEAGEPIYRSKKVLMGTFHIKGAPEEFSITIDRMEPIFKLKEAIGKRIGYAPDKFQLCNSAKSTTELTTNWNTKIKFCTNASDGASLFVELSAPIPIDAYRIFIHKLESPGAQPREVTSRVFDKGAKFEELKREVSKLEGCAPELIRLRKIDNTSAREVLFREYINEHFPKGNQPRIAYQVITDAEVVSDRTLIVRLCFYDEESGTFNEPHLPEVVLDKHIKIRDLKQFLINYYKTSGPITISKAFNYNLDSKSFRWDPVGADGSLEGYEDSELVKTANMPKDGEILAFKRGTETSSSKYALPQREKKSVSVFDGDFMGPWLPGHEKKGAAGKYKTVEKGITIRTDNYWEEEEVTPIPINSDEPPVMAPVIALDEEMTEHAPTEDLTDLKPVDRQRVLEDNICEFIIYNSVRDGGIGSQCSICYDDFEDGLEIAKMCCCDGIVCSPCFTKSFYLPRMTSSVCMFCSRR